MESYVRAHRSMGCVGAVAMPNTQPPVSRVRGENQLDSWTIEAYSSELRDAGGRFFDTLIVPLYLTENTTPAMIEEGAQAGLLKAVKYYPPHGTTNAEYGVPMDELVGGDVLTALEETGTILCIHGEQHGLKGEAYLDRNQSAESVFYSEKMPRLLEQHPKLRIVCEHVTTREAAEFVRAAGDRVGATVTPQHLLFTLGHLIQGLKYHLYCLPIVKFDADRAALQQAVLEANQSQFFAGTDSAPHTTKATECGCAAGCFTGNCAPQLYAMGFEAAGASFEDEATRLAFTRFLSTNGPAFYGLPAPKGSLVLEKTRSTVPRIPTVDGDVVPLPLGMNFELTWRLADVSAGE